MQAELLDFAVVFAAVFAPASDAALGWWRHLRDQRQRPDRGSSPDAWLEPKGLFWHVGNATTMTLGALRALFRRPLEVRSTVAQIESLGVDSVGIAVTTAVFVGMVMAVQFAYGLQRFGGMEYTGRIVGVSFSRELAPTLTAVIVGGRMSAGIAAEIGSMAVTEQLEAIRSLGADPLKKLVLPRILAATIVMPILAVLALVTGFAGAMWITDNQFGIPWRFFYQTALESVTLGDLWSGILKCPFFGAIIAIVGCHFGLATRGGTVGVGRATTVSVVVTSTAILVTDFFLTKLTLVLWPGG